MRLPSLAAASLVLVFATVPGPAAELEPTLGKKGKLLLEEKFETAALPAGWTRNTGELSVRDGSLHASELAADQHRRVPQTAAVAGLRDPTRVQARWRQCVSRRF
jgi:hypothetical protein